MGAEYEIHNYVANSCLQKEWGRFETQKRSPQPVLDELFLWDRKDTLFLIWFAE
jgi:hypothetical protein